MESPWVIDDHRERLQERVVVEEATGELHQTLTAPEDEGAQVFHIGNTWGPAMSDRYNVGPPSDVNVGL